MLELALDAKDGGGGNFRSHHRKKLKIVISTLK